MNRSGFTLIELLSVIVILAIIMVVSNSLINGTMSNTKTKLYEMEYKKLLKGAETELQSKIALGEDVDKSFSISDGDYKLYYKSNKSGEIIDSMLNGEEGNYSLDVTGEVIKNNSPVFLSEDEFRTDEFNIYSNFKNVVNSIFEKIENTTFNEEDYVRKEVVLSNPLGQTLSYKITSYCTLIDDYLSNDENYSGIVLIVEFSGKKHYYLTINSNTKAESNKYYYLTSSYSFVNIEGESFDSSTVLISKNSDNIFKLKSRNGVLSANSSSRNCNSSQATIALFYLTNLYRPYYYSNSTLYVGDK